jgi:integrase
VWSTSQPAQERFNGLRFHDLRHHFITKLAESGQPDAVILTLAHHVSKRMLEHYSHIRDVTKQKAVAAVESYCPGLPDTKTGMETTLSAKIM